MVKKKMNVLTFMVLNSFIYCTYRDTQKKIYTKEIKYFINETCQL